jgi:hypothetical protein
MTPRAMNFRALSRAAWPAAYTGAALLVGLRLHAYAFDDPFITYRVARNLATGQGMVYNPPERVNALTSPLHALILAGLHLFTGLDFPLLGAALTMAGLAVTAALVHHLLRRDPAAGPVPAALAGMLIVLSPLLVQSMGMETGLLLALTTAALVAHQAHRPQLTAVLLALALLTRLDAAIPAALIIIDDCASAFRREYCTSAVRRGFISRLIGARVPPTAQPLILIALILSPWFIFSRLYYGAFLPHTLAVKQAQVFAGGHWGGPWMFARALGRTVSDIFAPSDLTGILACACVLAGLAALARRRPRPALIIVAWAALHALAYGAVLRVPPYTWYFAPVLVALAVIAALGADELIRLTRARAIHRCAGDRGASDRYAGDRGAGALTRAIRAIRPTRPTAAAHAPLALFLLGLVLATIGRLFSWAALFRAFNPIHAGHALGYLVLIVVWIDGLKMKLRAFTLAAFLLAAAAFAPKIWNGLLPLTHLPTSQYRNYREAADWILKERPAAGTIGAHEIGVIGYYLPGFTIIDQCGIPTPGAAERLARNDMTWWVREYRPALLILHPALDWWDPVEGPLRRAPWFPLAYAPIHRIAPPDSPAKHSVEIYEALNPGEIPPPPD